MSVAVKIKNEITESKIAKVCCKRAFLSGVIRGAGSLNIEHNGLGLIIQHSSLVLIEKCAAIIRSLTKHDAELIKKDNDRSLGNRVIYELYLPGGLSKDVLKETGITSAPSQLNSGIPPALIKNECCKKSFLKGLFAASGTLSLAEDTDAGKKAKGYNLELFVSVKEIAKNVQGILAEFGINAKFREKRNLYSIYIKDSEKIGDFCALLGANEGYFALQDIILKRLVRNTANRQYNCEIANIDRSLAAANKQLEAILYIDKVIGLKNLDETLRTTAEARLKNPSASVNDILTTLPEPPTKSGFNHRMRKLLELADGLKKGGENA